MLKWCKIIHTFWTLAGQEMVSCHKWSKGLNRAKYRHQFYASSFWAILFPEAKGQFMSMTAGIPDLIHLKRCRCAGSKIVTKIANEIVHTVFCLNRSEVWWVSGICGNTHCILHMAADGAILFAFSECMTAQIFRVKWFWEKNWLVHIPGIFAP